MNRLAYVCKKIRSYAINSLNLINFSLHALHIISLYIRENIYVENLCIPLNNFCIILHQIKTAPRTEIMCRYGNRHLHKYANIIKICCRCITNFTMNVYAKVHNYAFISTKIMTKVLELFEHPSYTDIL